MDVASDPMNICMDDQRLHELCSEIVQRGAQVQEERAVAERLAEQLRGERASAEDRAARVASDLKHQDELLSRLQGDTSRARAQLNDALSMLSSCESQKLKREKGASWVEGATQAAAAPEPGAAEVHRTAADANAMVAAEAEAAAALRLEVAEVSTHAEETEQLFELCVLKGLRLATALQAILDNGPQAAVLLEEFGLWDSYAASDVSEAHAPDSVRALLASAMAISVSDDAGIVKHLAAEADDLRRVADSCTARARTAANQESLLEAELQRYSSEVQQLRAEHSELLAQNCALDSATAAPQAPPSRLGNVRTQSWLPTATPSAVLVAPPRRFSDVGLRSRLPMGTPPFVYDSARSVAQLSSIQSLHSSQLARSTSLRF